MIGWLVDCNECEKKFKTVKNLSAHANRVHGKIKQIVCSTCSKRFADKTELTRHIEYSHTQMLPEIWKLRDSESNVAQVPTFSV